jgi:hypothetical protein
MGHYYKPEWREDFGMELYFCTLKITERERERENT